MKRLTGQGAPNEAVIATSSADFAHLGKVLDASALSARLRGGSLCSPFALRVARWPGALCGLSLAEFRTSVVARTRARPR